MKPLQESKYFNTTTLFWLYLVATVAATIHLLALGTKSFEGTDTSTHYNNFVIFRNSFFHLVQQQDLYILYPAENYDLFKYSPTFAIAMGLFAWMPAWAGLICWNLASTILLFYAVIKFPFRHAGQLVWVLAFLFIENITQVQSSQTNSMIAALLLLAFTAFENGKPGKAALFILFTAFIKIFGIVAMLLFLFYPKKKQFIGYSFLWTVVLVFLPLIVVSPGQLLFLYQSWLNMLKNDHSISYGLSAIGTIKAWTGADVNKSVVTVAGIVLLLLPLVRVKAWVDPLFRRLYLAALMIWVIIFNHRAESSTFIIAVCGVAVWYFSQEHKPWRLALLVATLVLTCLSPTDLFPPAVRHSFFVPYAIKALPCIVVWAVLTWQLVTGKYAADMA